jgi:hypothetical protein
MHLTALLVPTLSNQLRALSGWLDKAEAFAAERGESPDGLLPLRLAPDMFPLTTQLRFLAFQAQEPVYRLRGEPVPEAVLEVRQEGRDGGDRPGTWAEARARIAEAAALLAALAPDEFDSAAQKPIAHDLPMGMIFDMTGEQYVRDWALPPNRLPPDDRLRHPAPGGGPARQGRLRPPHVPLPKARHRARRLRPVRARAFRRCISMPAMSNVR